MSGYAVYLSDGSWVLVPNYEFGVGEALLIWRDEEAGWPFIISRSEWLGVVPAPNVINAAASSGRRTRGGSAVAAKRAKGSKANRSAALADVVRSQLEEYQEKRGPGVGEVYGSVLMHGDHKDHFAAGIDGYLYVYEDGVYVPADKYVKERILGLANGKGWTTGVQRETLEWLHASAPELEDDPDINVINVLNGLLRRTSRGWKLTPHDPELRTTVQLPVTYDPQARCPRFDKYIKSSQTDPKVREFLAEWMGYNLVADNGHEKALINIGEGGDGKSVYLYIQGRLLGASNISNKTLHSLVSNRFASAELYGKLANISADLSAAELQDTGPFKEFTGGDRIDAEKKGKNPFQFDNVARFTFSANEAPASPDGSRGYFGRWFAVNWPEHFRDTERDTKRLKHLITDDAAEMSGVLNWALAGLTRLQKTGQFTDCPALEQARAQFRVGSDAVAAYLLDVAREKSGRWEKASAWYLDHSKWREDHGHSKLSAKKFHPKLRGWKAVHGLIVSRKEQEGYEYFRLDLATTKPAKRKRGR